MAGRATPQLFLDNQVHARFAKDEAQIAAMCKVSEAKLVREDGEELHDPSISTSHQLTAHVNQPTRRERRRDVNKGNGDTEDERLPNTCTRHETNNHASTPCTHLTPLFLYPVRPSVR